MACVLYVFFLAAGADPPAAGTPPARGPDADFAAAEQRIKALDQDIERLSRGPTMKDRLAPLYATRGWLRLRSGAPEKALADFDAALALDPNSSSARLGRGAYFRRVGQPALADAELRQVKPPRTTRRGVRPFNGGGTQPTDRLIPPAAAWVVVGIAWVLLVMTNVAVGWRQKVEASGTFLRLLWVAVRLALLQVLSLAVWAASLSTAGPRHVELPFAIALTFISLLFTLPYLAAPVRLLGTKEKLPRVTDEAFLARITELATKMKVPVPLVRLWPSTSASQQALAFVGTIQAPQLVVTDGILHRLSPTERDAIVAHELAHVANGSLWPLAAVLPVTCAAAMAAGAYVAPPLAGAFAVALFVGLKRLISRPYEIDCDRRAARAIGFRETAAALAKIHALHPVRNSGRLALLVYATATHPSREVRLAALRDAAPESDRPEVAVSDVRVRLQRRLTLAALVVWFVTVFGTLAAAILRPELVWLPLPLWAVALAPFVLLVLSQRRRLTIGRRRAGAGRGWLLAFLLGGLVWASTYFTFSAGDSTGPARQVLDLPFALLLSLAAPVAMLLWVLWTARPRKLRRAVAVAFQLHDFQRVLELARQSPRVVARDHMLRYNVALSRAILGDLPAAIAMLEQLWREKPRFALAGFALAETLLDADEPGRALEAIQAVVRRLPRDPGAHALLARVHRRLGQLDAAQAACDRVLALEPEDGTGHAAAAAVALDRGDLGRAGQWIAKALAFAPGEAYIVLVDAEIALETKPLESARVEVEKAIATVRANPLVLLHSDIARLEQKLRQREASACSGAGPRNTDDPGCGSGGS